MMPSAEVWTIIIALGLGTFLLRFSFLGLIGSRPLPNWLERWLRYTPVAVLPGLVAPLVVWPEATGGVFDPARAVAAVVCLVIGWRSGNMVIATVAGLVALYLMLGIGALI